MPKISLFAPLPIQAGILFLEQRLGKVGVTLRGMWTEFMSAVKALLWVTFILAVLATPFFLYEMASENGYVSHTVETSISARQDWMVGESKACYSFVLDADTARKLGQETGYVTSAVNCDGGSFHKIKVNFWGNLVQPEHKLIRWKCNRDSDGFTCKQTGAE